MAFTASQRNEKRNFTPSAVIGNKWQIFRGCVNFKLTISRLLLLNSAVFRGAFKLVSLAQVVSQL